MITTIVLYTKHEITLYYTILILIVCLLIVLFGIWTSIKLVRSKIVWLKAMSKSVSVK